MQFSHICPIPLLESYAKDRDFHLTLAHLVKQDDKYRSFYRNESDSGAVIIQDNSVFECYKHGIPYLTTEELIDLGHETNADYLVMTDYPAEPSSKTISAAKKQAELIRTAGFGTFFVPQSKIGDLGDLFSAFEWALTSDLIDYIGFSILSIPNAYGVEKDNRLQRYLSRMHFINQFNGYVYDKYNTSLQDLIELNDKKVHFLGMVDGPNEIGLIGDLKYLTGFRVDTWDSSSAIWAGINNVQYDASPTGLIHGKIESEVDFNHEEITVESEQKIRSNMEYIDKLAELG